jgi:hypothetical protein
MNIPASPDETYKEWSNWNDFLGTDKQSEYLPYEEAKSFVQNENLRSQKDWKVWCKTKRPKNIPSHPYVVYKGKWTTWGDWFGTGTIASYYVKYRPFEEARKFVRRLNLRNFKE